MTPARYRNPNKTEVIPKRVAAPIAVGTAIEDGRSRRITVDVHPANKEARRYFQTVPITGVIPRPTGLVAYQSPGRRRIQNEVVHATATPAGPHRSPKRNSRPVTRNSTTPQRSQRSALPMERWIHT